MGLLRASANSRPALAGVQVRNDATLSTSPLVRQRERPKQSKMHSFVSAARIDRLARACTVLSWRIEAHNRRREKEKTQGRLEDRAVSEPLMQPSRFDLLEQDEAGPDTRGRHAQVHTQLARGSASRKVSSHDPDSAKIQRRDLTELTDWMGALIQDRCQPQSTRPRGPAGACVGRWYRSSIWSVGLLQFAEVHRPLFN